NMPTTTNYIWDEENYLAESDGTNTINVVYTNEPQKYGNLVSTRISATTSYHHFDATGSTRQLTSSTAGQTDLLTYDSWGKSVRRAGLTPFGLQWVGILGYYFDDEVGTYHVRRRAYDAGVARWHSSDPFPITGTAIAILSHFAELFSYASNSPLLYIDPSGLDPSNCDRCADDILDAQKNNQSVMSLLTCINSLGCDVESSCICCKPNQRGCSGPTNDARKVKVLVCKQIPDHATTYVHELVHTLRYCFKNKLFDWKQTQPLGLAGSCLNCIQEEMLSYICAQQCVTLGTCYNRALASCLAPDDALLPNVTMPKTPKPPDCCNPPENCTAGRTKPGGDVFSCKAGVKQGDQDAALKWAQTVFTWKNGEPGADSSDLQLDALEKQRPCQMLFKFGRKDDCFRLLSSNISLFPEV
ncbi:MAG: hypothetical protein JSS02_27300, partial [Planctomycetes bacterium]|nr:hypothetical protein [Planctomycetota bacterium]